MSKKKKKSTSALEVSEPIKDIEQVEENFESKYESELKEKLSEISAAIEIQAGYKAEALQYLTANHQLYQTIKGNALSIQKDILPGKSNQKDVDLVKKSNAIFFDFENNKFNDGSEVKEMPTYYLNNGSDLHLCKDNGIYLDSKLYTSAKLFLTDKKSIDGDILYISSFEKAIDHVVNSYDLNGDFSCFCMLPESVDLFNTKIRRCLNTNKGKIISIPKSIAITYYYLNELKIGTRYCVVDMDGLHPVITQLSIGKDSNGNKVILREGFVPEKGKISFTYQKFAKQYLHAYEQKYKVSFSENEIDKLINNKLLSSVIQQREEVTLFREDGKVVIIYDNAIYNDCCKSLSTASGKFNNYSVIYVSSEVEDAISGNNIQLVSSQAAYIGLSKIRDILLKDNDAIIWKERLPKVSLEVIDETIGRFKTINLIEEDNEGQNIRLSIDEEVELPFKGTITLQKGKKEYYLPLEREIYSEDVNSAKEAYFFDKAFPLSSDILVELVVKYNYMSDSPIKIYARPRTSNKEFAELPNIWVDRHSIEEYSGPVYEGHPKDIKLPFSNLFITTKIALDRFATGRTYLDSGNFMQDKSGIKIHKDLAPISKAHFFVRSTFDSSNVDDNTFIRYWTTAGVDKFWQSAYNAMVTKASAYSAEDKQKYQLYRNGLIHILSEIIVASWYYDRSNRRLVALYKHLVELNKTKVLIKLSRCLLSKDDDIYGVFDALAEKLFDAFKDKKPIAQYDERFTYLRTLSQNCWFSKNWLSMLYYTKHGPDAIRLMAEYIVEYLKTESYGTDKSYRDIMEFLVCLTMVKNIDSDYFNPNLDSTRELLNSVKKSYEIVRLSIESDKLISRLEMRQDQGSLYGYPNYIYMLIMILSGEGQVDLVGYRDE